MVGVYVGLLVQKPVVYQRKYDLVLSEIITFLNVHAAEVSARYRLHRKTAGKLLVIEALSGGEPVTLPLNATLLHTMHFKVAPDSNPSDDIKQFASIVWECLQILRENYPSRIDLAEEGLDRCSPYFTTLSKAELMRREVSCIASRRDDPALMTSEEIAEVWFVLYTALKLHDARAVLICLQLLADSKHCPVSLFRNVRQSERNLLETLLEETGIVGFSGKVEEQCKSLAREVLNMSALIFFEQ